MTQNSNESIVDNNNDNLGDVGQSHLDKLLVGELNKMSLKERELVYEDVHGVNQLEEETPSFVAEKLEQLDREIQLISKKPAYDQAWQSNPSYVKDRSFRLSFLRADCFDSRKAATRLVNFMEGKLNYFGPDALTRPIALSDMDEDDMECLSAGQLQWLGQRDRAGRAVFCDFQTLFGRCYKRSRNLVSSLVLERLEGILHA